MRDLLQIVIPPALAALIAGRFAWTRTSRLLRTINTNLDLLDRLPPDHPKRATLEARNGGLLDLLDRRQQRRFGPFTQAGVSFGVLTSMAVLALMFAFGLALIAAGVIPSAPSDPPTPGDQWAAAGFLLVIAVGCIGGAFWAAHRQLKEHPPPAQQQPAEAG